jgi:hypothetical protein
MKRIAALVVSTLATLGMGAGIAASADASILPNQLFVGFVNNQRPSATIRMACFGPVRPGQTGHPVAGQTLTVTRSLDVPGGNTGSAGNEVQAIFTTPSVAVAATFRNYRTLPLPTWLTLPCAGSSRVSFVPTPSSRTARSDTVRVSFVGQP